MSLFLRGKKVIALCSNPNKYHEKKEYIYLRGGGFKYFKEFLVKHISAFQKIKTVHHTNMHPMTS